jgi:hypothetical protein
MTSTKKERKPHDLVLGRNQDAFTLEHSLEDGFLDMEAIYEYADKIRRSQDPPPRKHAEHDIAQTAQLVRYLLAELFRVENKLPKDEQKDRCPMCGHPYWTRPHKSDSMDFEYDYSKKRCRCCSHVRDGK